MDCCLEDCDNNAVRLINTQYGFCSPHFEELFVGRPSPGDKLVWVCEQVQE